MGDTSESQRRKDSCSHDGMAEFSKQHKQIGEQLLDHGGYS